MKNLGFSNGAIGNVNLFDYGVWYIRIGFVFCKKKAMKSPHCQPENKIKNDLLKGVQRYKCKECGCNYRRFIPIARKKKRSAALPYPCIWKA
jgi:hypothetical protein